jgi:hypothetical protein
MAISYGESSGYYAASACFANAKVSFSPEE